MRAPPHPSLTIPCSWRLHVQWMMRMARWAPSHGCGHRAPEKSFRWHGWVACSLSTRENARDRGKKLSRRNRVPTAHQGLVVWQVRLVRMCRRCQQGDGLLWLAGFRARCGWLAKCSPHTGGSRTLCVFSMDLLAEWATHVEFIINLSVLFIRTFLSIGHKNEASRGTSFLITPSWQQPLRFWQ